MGASFPLLTYWCRRALLVPISSSQARLLVHHRDVGAMRVYLFIMKLYIIYPIV